ncbi:NACHT domain-containing protein [Coleofasciculus chthonoplastes]|uniref:NACHT domain-containing protein n=1 Tax=Coleofasciculus chthonoplastes TaxID=64178 RepID=UPI0032FAA366
MTNQVAKLTFHGIWKTSLQTSLLQGERFGERAGGLGMEFAPSEMTAKTVTHKVDLAEAVGRSHYSVILGDPGAGKTTLLRYLALHFAMAQRDGKVEVLVDGGRDVPVERLGDGGDGEVLGNTRFPVFLRVADYAERLVKQPELSLLAFLEEFYQQWEADVRDVNDECRDVACYVSTLLCDKMRQGECLVLLDGLDEVFNQTSRQQIVKQIEAFVTDYEEVWRRDAEKEAEELLEAIHGNEGVKRLTGNPLLLTILALIHRNGSRLPHRRVELYALAVKTLIEDWQLSKNLPDAPKVVLRESEVIELLAPLAYWMHEEKPSGLITQAEAEDGTESEWCVNEINFYHRDVLPAKRSV